MTKLPFLSYIPQSVHVRLLPATKADIANTKVLTASVLAVFLSALMHGGSGGDRPPLFAWVVTWLLCTLGRPVEECCFLVLSVTQNGAERATITTAKCQSQ